MSNYWFFLSYARRNDLSYGRTGDNKDRQLIQRFYQDLVSEIISRGPASIPRTKTEVGFYDQARIETGDKWDETLAKALRTSRVLVCLYSRGYFESEYCGKEFQVFQSRVRDYSITRNATHLPLIIPVLWHRPDKFPSLPACTFDIQYVHDEFGSVYAVEGLEYIMRLQKCKDDYTKFLMRFTDKLIAVAEEHTMPALAKCPPLKNIQSAFHASTPISQAVVMPNGAQDEVDDEIELENKGPGVVHLVFAAASSQELRQVRTKLEAYTEWGGRYWKPYVPDVDKQVGFITQQALTDMELQQEVLPFNRKLTDKILKADEQESNVIILIVVDPWSLLLDSYHQRLNTYDRVNLVRCAILVAWNDREQEPGINPEDVKLKVRQTFLSTIVNKNMYFRDDVSSEPNLRNEVQSAIIEIQRKLAERANLLRPVPKNDAGFTLIPQITGPGGTQ
jgi:FxsC-like protein